MRFFLRLVLPLAQRSGTYGRAATFCGLRRGTGPDAKSRSPNAASKGLPQLTSGFAYRRTGKMSHRTSATTGFLAG